MIQIFHPYTKWECHENGLYKTTCFMDDHSMIQECYQLLSCPEWLYESMSMVTHSWFYSCEHFLSNELRNRQAYLGQAACCLIHGAPEYITKQAWSLLDPKQQSEANKIADDVLDVWIEKHNRGFFKWERDTLSKTSCPLHPNE
jgi:hypothetical protein